MHKHFHIPFKNLKVPKPQHGWRTLFGEVGVIVVGVLIALGAEQVVQNLHWHEKTEAAENAMRIEMRDDNMPIAYIRILIYPCINTAARQLIDHADTLSTVDLRAQVAVLKVPFDTYDSEAWRAVQASDVANHVGAEKLIDWSKPYRLMPTMSSKTAQESVLQADLRAVIPASGDATAENRMQLRKIASELLALNNDVTAEALVLFQRLASEHIVMNEASMAELESDTRAEYGTCVHRPDLGRPFNLSHGHTYDRLGNELTSYLQ